MKNKLNIGCGLDKIKGYLNCDNSQLVNPDMVIDLEKELPFRDNSFVEVSAYHVLEHINNFIKLMKELHRVCKKGAVIKIRVPFYKGLGAFSDPTHVRFFTTKTFDYFDGKCNPWEIGLEKPIFKVSSKINYSIGKYIGLLNFIFNPLINISNVTKVLYQKFFSGIFPADEIKFELRVLKE